MAEFKEGDLVVVVNCLCDREGSIRNCTTFPGGCSGKIGRIERVLNGNCPYDVDFFDEQSCFYGFDEIALAGKLGRLLYGNLD